jgi:hypothetical protein
MSRLTKVLVGLGCVVVLGMVYLWVYGVQTLVGFEARALSRNQPIVNQPLNELADVSVSAEPGTKFSARGYEFELPWNDPDLKHVDDASEHKVTVQFGSGRTLFITSGPPNTMLDGMLAQQQTTRENLAPVWGEEAVRSDYDFKKAILSATPDKVSRRSSKAEAFRLGMQLAMKSAIAPPSSGKEFFLLKSEEFRGFQYGAPEDQLYDLEVELYSHDIRLEIHFNRDMGSAPPITQAEINRVVQSLHKLPENKSSTEPVEPKQHLK